MRFTLPSSLVDNRARVKISGGVAVWFEQEGELILCTYDVGMAQDDECTGTGATIADAFLAMLVSEWWVGFSNLNPKIASALDELAHQAVRIVCNRLSGGTMDSATFAEVAA